MSKRQKYHFLTIKERSGGGTSVTALPGQTLNGRPVPTEILVKNIGNGTSVARCRKAGKPGDIFFTTTLKNAGSCLKVRDIYPLSVADEDIIFSDVREIYENTFGKAE